MFSNVLIACFTLVATVAAASKNAGTWSVTEVNAWLMKEIPELAERANAFGLDGETLLHITDDDLEDEFEMTSALKRRTALGKLHSLRTDTDGDGDIDADDLPNKGIFYFRTFHRRETDVHLSLLMGSPRIGIWYLDDNYSLTNVKNDNFPLSPGGLIWSIVSPHSFLAMNRGDIMGGLPWYFGVILWVSAIRASVFYFQLIAYYGVMVWVRVVDDKQWKARMANGDRQWKATLARTVVVELVLGLISGFFYLVYPHMQRSLCDLSFYFMIFIIFLLGVRSIFIYHIPIVLSIIMLP